MFYEINFEDYKLTTWLNFWLLSRFSLTVN